MTTLRDDGVVRFTSVDPTRASEGRGVVDTGERQPRVRASASEVDRENDPGRFDAVAGCEFVDDRIRLLE